MNLKITKEQHWTTEYTVTVYGPADRSLTYTIIQLSSGLWRTQCGYNGFRCLYWPDTDLRTQLRLIYGALRKDVHERRAARKDRKKR